MLTIERCRRILGENISHLTDEEVAALCSSYELLAEIALEAMLREQNANSPDSNEQ